MSRGARAWLPLAALLALGVLAALAGGQGRDTGRPLDPASTGELGTRALVLLLEEMGADVSISAAAPGPREDVVLLLSDALPADAVTRLRSWVAGGGTLVLTDPFSELAPLLGRASGGLFDELDPDTTLTPACDMRAVSAVQRIEVPIVAGFEVPDEAGAVGCFEVPGGQFLVARSVGEGSIVALAGPGLWVNANLAEADNAVLAASLLAPTPGSTVRFLEPPGPGEGRRSLTDLIRPSIRTALWQLVIAFALYAAWRARRLGGPIVEARAVEVPGSELVVAVGDMLHKAGRHDQASAMIRRDVVRALAERLGLGPDPHPDVLLDALALRTDRPRHELRAVLFERVPANDRELAELAAVLETIKTEVLHA